MLSPGLDVTRWLAGCGRGLRDRDGKRAGEHARVPPHLHEQAVAARAHVDPSTLRVSLLVPETGQVITDPPVSHGTRTLLYVLMRIGLAQHMSAIGEPVPLVLDDPFVDLDSRRLRRIMELFARSKSAYADTSIYEGSRDHGLVPGKGDRR